MPIVGCNRLSGPPKTVLDEAIETEHESHEGQFGKDEVTNLEYKVTNNYTRQIKDETFHIYEFDAKWTHTFHATDENAKYLERGQESQQEKHVIAFVKRGNSWRSQKWDPHE